MRRKNVELLVAAALKDAIQKEHDWWWTKASARHQQFSAVNGQPISLDSLHMELLEMRQSLINKVDRRKEGEVDPLPALVERILVEHGLIERFVAEKSASSFNHSVIDRMYPVLSVNGLPGDEVGKVIAEKLAAARNVQDKEGSTAAMKSLK